MKVAKKGGLAQSPCSQGVEVIIVITNIHELVAKNPDILGVRLGVKQTGCAGFGYVLDTVTEPEKDDLVFETDGAKLYVALQAMPFIDGTEVDYVREGLNQLFKFHNPKAQNECGCGESFGV